MPLDMKLIYAIDLRRGDRLEFLKVVVTYVRYVTYIFYWIIARSVRSLSFERRVDYVD